MKKIKSCILAAMVLGSALLGGAGVDAKKPTKPKKPVAVFYIPHQDDELLSFGVAILNHVERGADVKLVLYTDGEGSGLVNKMGITKAEFGAARDKEFRLSTRFLRVKPSNITYLNLPDGTVTKAQMEKIILKYEKMYPGARHKAYSYYDQHNDHKVAGQALNDLYNQGKVSDARFYINYGRYDTPGKPEIRNPKKYSRNIKMAASAYKKNNPKWGSYAIGYRSAGKHLFDNVVNNPQSYYHLPNQ